jgi:cytochrome bd-type quinol oxidase subunit 2
LNRTPNVLLAVTSVLALFLVAFSAISTATAEKAPVYLACALFSALGFIVLNGLWMHSRKRRPKPLIDRAAPVTLIMAMVFPMAIILSAALPLIAPNGDYGLMLIMAGVWTGLTLQSARAALKQG